MTIRKALIPAAGLGTRMRPFSLAAPKELAPVGSKPALHRVVEEAAAAGLREIGVVVSPEKGLIRDYLHRVRDGGDLEGLDFHFIRQPSPRGLADAMLRAGDFLAGEPFMLMLPDNLLLSPEHRLAPMLGLADESGMEVAGVVELGAGHSGLFGNSGRVEDEEAGPGVIRLTRLADKLPGKLEIEPGATVRRACGRLVCQPHFLDYLERCRLADAGDYDEVPALQRIIVERGALGVILPPPLFDVGHPAGLLAASAWLHRQTERNP